MDPADDYLPKAPSADDLKPNSFHDENLVAAESLDDSIETTNPGKAVWLIACTVSMGGFLFGRPENPAVMTPEERPSLPFPVYH